MMIEVNLLPGRQKSGRGERPAFGALAAKLGGGVRDPYLTSAIVALLAVAGGVGTTQTLHARTGDELAEREERALADSTRMSSVIQVRAKAMAERDSVHRQLAIIAAIDSNRYVWAHVLDEVSRSLPPYTWVTSLQQTSAAPSPPPRQADVEAKAKEEKEKGGAKGDKAPADSAAGPQVMRFRVVGQTVDIQALTSFMRDLEGSPFVQRVQLAKSEAVMVDGKDVTEFTLDGEFEAPPKSVVRTQAVTVPVR